MKSKILILEDERIIAFDLLTTLQEKGYEVLAVARSAEEAIEQLEDRHIDLMIVDVKLDGQLHGEEAASAIRSHFGLAIPVIFISGSTDSGLLKRDINEPCTILMKPFQVEDLVACIEAILSSD